MEGLASLVRRIAERQRVRLLVEHDTLGQAQALTGGRTRQQRRDVVRRAAGPRAKRRRHALVLASGEAHVHVTGLVQSRVVAAGDVLDQTLALPGIEAIPDRAA